MAKNRGSREERERARLYRARMDYHNGRRRRRTRDNVASALIGGFLILIIAASQVAFFTVGPGEIADLEPASTVVPTTPSEIDNQLPIPSSTPATPTPAATPDDSLVQ